MKFAILDGNTSGKDVNIPLSQVGYDSRVCEAHQASLSCQLEARLMPLTDQYYNENEIHVLQKFNSLDRTLNMSVVFSGADYDKSLRILISGPIISYLSYKSNQQMAGLVKYSLTRNAAVHLNTPYPPDQQWVATGDAVISTGGNMVHHVKRDQTYLMTETEISRNSWAKLRGYPLKAHVKLQIGFALNPENESGELNRKILTESIATDLSIVCGNGSVIMCHKSFLMAASPVFAAMLSSDMTEASTNTIDMRDMSQNGIKAFLGYLYCQDLSAALASSEVGIEVLKAADKYDVPKLKQKLSQAIGTQPESWFNPDTALEMYHFSLQVNDHGLNMKAIHAIKGNIEGLMTRPKYLTLFKENPAAAMDLCKSAFNMIPIPNQGQAPEAGNGGSHGVDEAAYRRRLGRHYAPNQQAIQLLVAPQYAPQHNCNCMRHAIQEAVHDAVVVHVHDHFYGNHGPDQNNNFQGQNPDA